MVVYPGNNTGEKFNDAPRLSAIYPIVDGQNDTPLPFGFIPMPESERKAMKDHVPLFFSSIDYQVIPGELHMEPSHYESTHKTAVYEGEHRESVYEL